MRNRGGDKGWANGRVGRVMVTEGAITTEGLVSTPTRLRLPEGRGSGKETPTMRIAAVLCGDIWSLTRPAVTNDDKRGGLSLTYSETGVTLPKMGPSNRKIAVEGKS